MFMVDRPTSSAVMDEERRRQTDSQVNQSTKRLESLGIGILVANSYHGRQYVAENLGTSEAQRPLSRLFRQLPLPDDISSAIPVRKRTVP